MSCAAREWIGRRMDTWMATCGTAPHILPNGNGGSSRPVLEVITHSCVTYSGTFSTSVKELLGGGDGVLGESGMSPEQKRLHHGSVLLDSWFFPESEFFFFLF